MNRFSVGLRVLVGIGMVGALLSGRPAHAEGPPVFKLAWGPLAFPRGVAVDPSGNVYVTEIGNTSGSQGHRVQKFDGNGNFLTSWGGAGSGDGQLRGPIGIAVDSASQSVYVTEVTNARVQKFDTAGNFLAKWGSAGAGAGQFDLPAGIAVDPGSGNVYVADTNNHRIQVFQSDGTFVTEWDVTNATVCPAPNVCNTPYGVAVSSSGSVYVANLSARIQKFNSDGTALLAIWGSSGVGDGQFKFPQGIAVDAMGDVYVTEQANSRVQKFDGAGQFLAKWGSGGTGDGEFDDPFGVAVDAAGNVFVVDATNLRVQKFGPLEAGIDVKPGSSPNCFNINGQGVIPVAILGSATFDVTAIDALTLAFDGLAVRVRGNKGPLCSLEDSDLDTYTDLVCHFEDDTDNWMGGGATGTVTGRLLDGTAFRGTDSICVVP